MSYFKKVSQNGHEGTVSFNKNIVTSIVKLAIEELEYVELCYSRKEKQLKANSICVNFDKDGLIVDVNVKIHYTQSVSETAFKIQEAIMHSIESMTEYKISTVNINVSGVLFDDVSLKSVTKEG